VLVSAEWNDGLNIITLTYDENLNSSSTPATTDFTVTGRTVTLVSNDLNTKVYVTVDGNLSPGATISYVSGGNPIEDLAGNNAANLTNQAISGIPASGAFTSFLKAFGGASGF
jgi:hypothetical protein